MIRLFQIAAAAVLVASATSAMAQERVEVGVLECQRLDHQLRRRFGDAD